MYLRTTAADEGVSNQVLLELIAELERNETRNRIAKQKGPERAVEVWDYLVRHFAEISDDKAFELVTVGAIRDDLGMSIDVARYH